MKSQRVKKIVRYQLRTPKDIIRGMSFTNKREAIRCKNKCISKVEVIKITTIIEVV